MSAPAVVVVDGEPFKVSRNRLVQMLSAHGQWCAENHVPRPATLVDLLAWLTRPATSSQEQQNTAVDDDDGPHHGLMTYKEAAARLTISERAVRRLVDAGTLPVVRLGLRSVRIPAAAVDALAFGVVA